MTRFFLVLFLALAAGGTFVAVRWLLGDEEGARQTAREQGLEDEPERRRPEDPERKTPKRAGKSAFESTLSGYVTGTSGAPIEGVRVRFGDRTAATDRDGAYRFELVPATGEVRAEMRGYFPAVRERDGVPRLDFELIRAAVLFGTVVDEAGQPVLKAQVYLVNAEHQILDPSGSAPVVESDQRGEFVFLGVAPGTTDVGVKADGYLPQVRPDFHIVGLQEHRLDFVVKRGRSIFVELLDRPDGVTPVVRIADSRLRGELLPPGGLALLARAFPGRALADYPVIEREFPPDEPRISIDGLPPGPVDIELVDPQARYAGHVFDEETPYFVAEEGIGKLLDNTDSEVKLRLLPAGLVATVVRDALTNDLLFPRVTRLADDKGPMPVDVWIEDKMYVVPTDSRRHRLRFEMAGYESKDVELPAERKGIVDLEASLQPLAGGETGSLRIVFDPKLEGRVGVVGRGEAGARQFEAKRDKEGNWIVGKIPVGTWDFTLLASKMTPAKVPGVAIVAGTTQEVRVALYPGGGMELKVVDATGELLEKVTLDLRDANNERIDIHFVTMVSGERGFTSINYIPSAATARTDSGLAPGAYTLYAGRQGYEVGKADFVVVGTDVAQVTVVLEKK